MSKLRFAFCLKKISFDLTLSFESKNEQISGKSKSAEKEKEGKRREEEVAIFFRLPPSSAK